MRLSVRVRPGASRTAVSGQYGQSAGTVPDVLCVAVTARAVDGAANNAVLRAVADAFGLHRREVRLISGLRSRSKVLELDGPPADLQERLTVLLGA